MEREVCVQHVPKSNPRDKTTQQGARVGLIAGTRRPLRLDSRDRPQSKHLEAAYHGDMLLADGMPRPPPWYHSEGHS